MPGRTTERRNRERETDATISVLNLREGDSLDSPPLNAPLDQVLMQIKDEGSLTFPGKLKSDPAKRSRNKYCRFHRDHGHDTADCYDLKQQIEALIRDGSFRSSSVEKGRTSNRGNRPPGERMTVRNPPLGK